jgi:hypothetical protein
MQKRAGLLFLAKTSSRILLILNETQKWTVPTFVRNGSLLDDATEILNSYCQGKILPIELYLSADNEFEFSTYICLVDQEFLDFDEKTISWASLDHLPNNLHNGLRFTLTNEIIKTKISTVLETININ